MTVPAALDSAGRGRSPATLPRYHVGRPPRNTEQRYPVDLPTGEQRHLIVYPPLMREIGQDWQADHELVSSSVRAGVVGSATAPITRLREGGRGRS